MSNPKDDSAPSWMDAMAKRLAALTSKLLQQAQNKVIEMSNPKDDSAPSWMDAMAKRLAALTSSDSPRHDDETALTSNAESFKQFRAVAEQAAIVDTSWRAFYAGMSAVDTDTERKRQFAALDQGVRAALDKLRGELSAPTLRIATTGTTSSGKSSIVNLLAGAIVMPVEEREMSAGVVVLRYSTDGSRRLKIDKTSGAKWPCGEWRDLADADIKQRLTDTMHTYNRARDEGRKMAAPEIELEYPLACFQPNGFLHVAGLPTNTQFELIDLPGLRNVTDELNRQIVTRSKESLCLVAYNMAETDELKRQALVQEVLSQIKTMGGSPARMLFVLNRIDVFRKDANWEHVQHEEIERRKKEIAQILRQHLPEHRRAIDQLVFARLSSAPALCSRRMIDQNFRIDATGKLDSHYNFLIPEKILGDLPRKIEKWEDADIKRVSEAVWNYSYGAEFSDILRRHIEEHFEVLMLPPIVARFEVAANEAIGQALRTSNTILDSSQERYAAAKTKLAETDQALKNFLADARRQLLQPLKKRLTNPSDIALALELAVEDWMKEEMYKSALPTAALTPLYNWKEELSRAALGLITAAAQSLLHGGIDFSRTSAATMPAKVDPMSRTVFPRI